jgi:coenzyme F420-reducing hydrogenase alpha subunit
MKKLGNDILEVILGRATHPINVRVGGFYRVPTKQELEPLLGRLKEGLEDCEAMIRLMGTLEFPDLEVDYESVSVCHDKEYPFNEGRIKSSKGLDIDVTEFLDHIIEEHVPHSTSLHSRIEGERPYLVGPNARYNLNYELLTPRCKKLAKEVGLGKVAQPLRVAICGSNVSPSIFDSVNLLGRENTLTRIDMTIKRLGEQK